MKLLASRGEAIPLGAELGRGGEGSVFAVTDQPRLVAKRYHRPVGPEQTAKLRAMVAQRTDRLLQLAAWPIDTLHERPDGPVVGLLMPRVEDHKPIHLLYSPKARRTEFPRAGWPFCVHAAANVARAFAVVHEHGHVIGDVNHGNVVVSRQATAMLIDCDSFQVTANGQRYLCEVGVSTHQPPELQALPTFRGVVRTPNHDNFGLAVLIFQLLLMGRHPFAGTFLGSGDVPIEQAIRECRFAYGPGALARQMRPPPHSPPLEVVSPHLAALFERAFALVGARDGARPTAREWVRGLERLAEQVKRCTRRPGHSYLETLARCPWCEIEAQTGAVLFAPTVTDPPRVRRRFDLTAVWAAIEAVPAPGPAPAWSDWPTPPALPSPRARQLGRARRLRQAVALALTGAGVAAGLAGVPFGGNGVALDVAAPALLAWAGVYRGSGVARGEAEQRLAHARAHLRALEVRWKTEAGDGAFRAKRRELERARREYKELPARRQRELGRLTTDLRHRQLRRFLDQYPIVAGAISGIGPGREATLRSYGVETAADVTPEALAAIPGFGPARATQLLAWRERLAQQFVFDPARGVDPRDVDEVETDLGAAERRIERTLSAGAAQLRQIAQRIVAQRQALWSEIKQAQAELARAEADLRVL